MPFLCWGAKASNLGLVHIANQQRFYRKTFPPRGVRCCASGPADIAKEELSWNCLYSNFSLKPSTRKCRLNHLRSHSSSVSFLKFLSRLVRIEASWGKKSRGMLARRATGSPRHMRAGGEAVMVLVEFCVRVWNKQIQLAFC